ncbi:histone deacetylase family protein [Methylotenera sp.]|uniref:histone deacetylase family protein n=1 Tax=Methylotenera sp. TaxID=2051956 RepID=UPI002730FB12|nr:histone deacetylase family protein [Methylotenera sp.]MDP2071998.1 histone deacetylase family protein [Methylotenera sp.]MDP3006993.1 histone deacetylase family protein [Methylotenera sp.]MDP3007070.1 histone deacetylase family protein [Methylotenera sp.]
MQTAYITHPEFLKHDMGIGHPECPARIHAIQDQLIASGLFDFLSHYEAQKASKEVLALAHTQDYIEWVFNHSPESGLIDLDGDTLMNPYTLDAALYACGAVVKAVDLVISGEVQNAFCNIRPPGHHAKRAGASGFCIFNNVAVAAAHALEHHGLERIAIADFDVHHGDGTEDIFHDEPRVMLCSTFQHPYYPYCGADSGNDHIINVPLAAGSSGEQFRDAITEQWLPALERFQPQMILISAGFDAHREDDMGGLALRESDYLWVTEMLKDIAKRHANGRIVSALEGGYSLHALGRSVMTHIKSLGEF